MDISQINSYSSVSTRRDSVSSSSSLSTEQSLSLFMAQLSNQDALDPMQDTEFVAQMAQFTSLRALENLNQYASYQYGSSLIGKEVNVAMYDSTGKYVSDTGVVTQADYSSGDATVIVNGRSYGTASTMEVLNDANYSSYQYVASLVGKKVQVTGHDVNGNVIENTGIVSSCTFASGEAMVVVDGQRYTLSAVRQVLLQNADPELTDPETFGDTAAPDIDSSGSTDPDTEGRVAF